MGIGWVIESERKAFWLTFLLPFVGGFLYTRQWAAAFGMLLAIPFLLLLSLLVAFFAVESVFPQVSRGCDPGFGLGCWGHDPLTAAELSHNQLVDFATFGLWGLFVISWLLFFGLCAVLRVREKQAETPTNAERVPKPVRAQFRTPVRACPDCSGKVKLNPFSYCNTCDGQGTVRE